MPPKLMTFVTCHQVTPDPNIGMEKEFLHEILRSWIVPGRSYGDESSSAPYFCCGVNPDVARGLRPLYMRDDVWKFFLRIVDRRRKQ